MNHWWVAITAIFTATVALVGCSSSEESTSPSELDALQAYNLVLDAVDGFEGGAERAAQDGGPVGLANFAIANGTLVSDAAAVLQQTLTADPTAGGFTRPELVMEFATYATEYGATLARLAAGLAECPEGDKGCYDAAYDAEAGSTARDQMRAAHRAVQQEASQ